MGTCWAVNSWTVDSWVVGSWVDISTIIRIWRGLLLGVY